MLRTAFALSFLVLGTAACGDSEDTGQMAQGVNCAEETRKDVFTLGMVKSGEAGLQVRLVDALPAPPVEGDNTWMFEVLDDGGLELTDVDIRVQPWMPDHGHGTSRTAQVLAPAADGDTTFTAEPVNLRMPGFWEVHLHIERDDTQLDSVVFNLCIDG